jgi:hypothetical protein
MTPSNSFTYQNRRKLAALLNTVDNQATDIFANENEFDRNSKCTQIVLDQLEKSQHYPGTYKRAVSTKPYNTLYLNRMKKFKKKG